MENVSDGNVLARMGDGFDLTAWQASGLDPGSVVADDFDLEIDSIDQSLTWSSGASVLRVDRDQSLDGDYFGRTLPGSEVPVGPFIEGWSPVPRRIMLGYVAF